MESQLKVVLITSGELRHRYYAKKLSENLNIVGIVSEEKSPVVVQTISENEIDNRDLKTHFNERNKIEKYFLGTEIEFPDTYVEKIPHGNLNSEAVFSWVDKKSPDYVLLYGSGILKNPLLGYFENKIVNLHLGLSPYYKGSGTNFFPFVNNEPQCVGGTIHLAILEVDAGAVLHQFRPTWEFADRIHHAGTKVIMKAAEVLPDILYAYNKKTIMPQEQTQSTDYIYKVKDFSADKLRKAWENLDKGLVREYLSNEILRNKLKPIITQF